MLKFQCLKMKLTELFLILTFSVILSQADTLTKDETYRLCKILVQQHQDRLRDEGNTHKFIGVSFSVGECESKKLRTKDGKLNSNETMEEACNRVVGLQKRQRGYLYSKGARMIEQKIKFCFRKKSEAEIKIETDYLAELKLIKAMEKALNITMDIPEKPTIDEPEYDEIKVVSG